MPGHDSRSNMEAEDVLRVSRTDGELLSDINVWGVYFRVHNSLTPGTRKIPPPDKVGRRIDIGTIAPGAEVTNVTQSDGGAIGPAAATTLAFTGTAQAILESFEIGSGVRWMLTHANGAALS